MPAPGKVGPRPGCLRGAFFSSGRTGRLGRESDCGGARGGEKVLPLWLEGARFSTAGGAVLLFGGSATPGGGRLQPAPRPHLRLRLSGPEGSAGAFFLVRRTRTGSSRPARGEGARVPGAGRRWLLAPSPEWLVSGSSEGDSLPLPGGFPPTSCVLSPPGSPGRGLEGAVPPGAPGSNLAEVAAFPGGPGQGGGKDRERRLALRGVGGSAGGLLDWHGRSFQDAPEQRERSARTQAPAAPRPGRRPGRRRRRRSRWLQGTRAAPGPGAHPFPPLALARNVGL